MASSESSSPLCLKETIAAVALLFASRAPHKPADDEVFSLLKRLNNNPEEYTKYLHWDEHKYTRNLIFKNEHFGLMALCWPPMRTSPIHDHANAGCWMRIMQSELQESRYSIAKNEDNTLQVPQLISTSIFKTNEVAYMDDNLGVHAVANKTEVPAISLHLYAPAFEACQYWDATGSVCSGKVCFYSIDGEKLPAMAACPTLSRPITK